MQRARTRETNTVKTPTFFLFPPFPFVAYLDGTNGQNYGNDEEKDSPDDAGRDCLVLDSRRHWELDFVRAFVALR